jgi:O-antigen/teichoic acid export membrane protein
MSLLGTIGVFGLGTVLIGELPRRKPRAGLVSAALLTSGIGSILLGVVFAIVAPLLSGRFEDILGEPIEAITFVVGVALSAVSTVFDCATIGLLRGGVQLSRNFIFAVVKMLALPIIALVLRDQFGIGISLSWVIGIATSLFISAVWLRFRGSPIIPRPDWAVLRALGKTALAHNWLNLAIAVPVMLIPVLVTVVVSPSANAAFYVAWMLTSFLSALPVALSTVLFAVAAAEPHKISKKLRFSFKLSMLIGLPGVLVLCLSAHFVLSLFGRGYAREATFPLWLLSLAYIPGLPKTFYIAVCRAAGRISRAAVVLTTFAAIEIAAAGVGGWLDGLKGLSIALLAETVLEGLATTPAVLRSAMGHGRHRRTGMMYASVSLRSITVEDKNLPEPNSSNNCPSAHDFPPTCTEALRASDEDQQAAGLAALMSLARCTASTVPFPVVLPGTQVSAGGRSGHRTQWPCF